MNSLDIAFIVVLFFFFIRGIFRGFIKEIAGLVGLAGGFFLAARFYPVAAETLKPFIQNPSYRQAIGFQLLFLVIFFVISLLGILLNRLVRVTMSQAANGLLGGALGLVKGAALSAVILMAATAFISPNSSFFQGSAAWPYLHSISQNLKQWVPEELKQALKDKIDLLPSTLTPGKTPTPAKEGAETPPPKTGPPAEPKPVTPPKPSWPGKPNE